MVPTNGEWEGHAALSHLLFLFVFVPRSLVRRLALAQKILPQEAREGLPAGFSSAFLPRLWCLLNQDVEEVRVMSLGLE